MGVYTSVPIVQLRIPTQDAYIHVTGKDLGYSNNLCGHPQSKAFSLCNIQNMFKIGLDLDAK